MARAVSIGRRAVHKYDHNFEAQFTNKNNYSK